jgi:hypothetical protein
LEWLWSHARYEAWSSTRPTGHPYNWEEGTRYDREKLHKALQDATSSVVVDYFSSFREIGNKTTDEGVLRWFLHDILEQDKTFFSHFRAEFQNLKASGSQKWSYLSLQSILSSLARAPFEQQISLILDDMDEFEEDDRREVLKLLYGSCSGSQGIIGIFLIKILVLYKFLLTTLKGEKSLHPKDIQHGEGMLRFTLFACRSLQIVELHHILPISQYSDPLKIPSGKEFKRALGDIEKRIVHCGGSIRKEEDHNGALSLMQELDLNFFLISLSLQDY